MVVCDSADAFASVAAWNLGLVDEATKHCKNALELAPDNARLLANLQYMTSPSFTVENKNGQSATF